jgi:polyhydroxyalkanoate synthesis regulator phasin
MSIEGIIPDSTPTIDKDPIQEDLGLKILEEINSLQKGRKLEDLDVEELKIIKEKYFKLREVLGLVPVGRSEGVSSSEDLSAKMEMAQEILGENFMGPEKIEKTFGIKLDLEEIPDMPYSAEDLETAKEMGEMLVLGIDEDNEGNRLTISRMIEMIPEVIDPATGTKVKVLYNQRSAGEAKLGDGSWYKNETFFTGVNKDGSLSPESTPRLRWRLTSKAPLPESITAVFGGTAESSTNYIEQTKILRDHLLSLGSLTEEEARGCSDEVLKEIETLMGTNRQEAARKLSDLEINKNHRRMPAEIMYDTLLALKGNDERILENTYDWSNSVSSGGGLVRVGFAGADGALVLGWLPDDRRGDVGVFSLR